ncbi:hypothetical protein EJB05_22710 [Eragrostis curvula]|uniref:Uncharacterized protein n=1 Tax=Eragrostis curvula TaxID=38414 RepID=A0A5J9V548_9POAL|nr:hypothetical protein EJB05_22710 [Eragrostis curvula]
MMMKIIQDGHKVFDEMPARTDASRTVPAATPTAPTSHCDEVMQDAHNVLEELPARSKQICTEQCYIEVGPSDLITININVIVLNGELKMKLPQSR